MSHAAKHPSPDQRVADALKEELLRALHVFDRANDMRGVFYDFEVALHVRGKQGSDLSVHAVQTDGVWEKDEPYAHDEEQSVRAAAADFRKTVLFSDGFDPDHFKVADLVGKLNAYFEAQGQPPISHPDLGGVKEIH